MLLADSITKSINISVRRRGKSYQFRSYLPNGQRIEKTVAAPSAIAARKIGEAYMAQFLEVQFEKSWTTHVASGLQPKGWLRAMRLNVIQRAKKKGGRITLGELEAIALRTNGRCEVTGVQFVLANGTGHPFQPSLDRIDSFGEYDLQNCRMVCLSVNYAMSRWGESAFKQLAWSMVAKLAKEQAELGAAENFGVRVGVGILPAVSAD